MRNEAPFQREDLHELDTALLAKAVDVVSLYDVWHGYQDPDVIAMRHDVDDAGFDTALKIAEWEEERGFRSTYFILHTAPYWADEKKLRTGLETIFEFKHEIGIHTNALVEGLRSDRHPDNVLHEALGRLRSWGFPVKGVAGHGDPHCYGPDGKVRFANDEHFIECARPEFGDPDRVIRAGTRALKLEPRPLADFGLVYEALRLPRSLYLSDSGGRWRPDGAASFAQIVNEFPSESGQLQVLWHPDWWGQAFQDKRLPREE